MTEPLPSTRRRVPAFLASADFARAYTLTVFGVVLSTHLIERTAGTVTLATIIAAQCVIGLLVLIARRDEISLVRLVPTTLLIFLAWALVSVAWSTEPGQSAVRWVSTAALAFLAVTIGHIRDTLQTVRALGDVCRVLLGASLALEILSGILLDMPFHFLGIQGNIAAFGPIQGIFGTRNMLGFVAVVALVTFLVEQRTQSVRPGVAVASTVLAAVLALLSASPTVYVVAAVVAVGTAALTIVRRAQPARRAAVQWAIAGVVVIAGIVGYAQRSRIIEFLGADDDLQMRTDLWSLVGTFVRRRPVQGWGWFGPWEPDEAPFATLNWLLDQSHSTALNAYIDVLLQLGWAGLLLFCAFGGIALVRSWLDASQRRSIVYAWTPLLLITLGVVSLFESFTLYGAGWLLLVLCAVRAGQSRSWRERLGAGMPADGLAPSQATQGPAR